jgi:methyl-accepting chemotaxis protein
MNWFNKLTVGSKLLGGFLIVAVIGALIGVLGIVSSSQINALGDQMYEKELLGLRHTAEANTQMMAATRAMRSAILSHLQSSYAASMPMR